MGKDNKHNMSLIEDKIKGLIQSKQFSKSEIMSIIMSNPDFLFPIKSLHEMSEQELKDLMFIMNVVIMTGLIMEALRK